ncbi:etoposide-induced protein 2.4-domain-containing protein [Hygrophoropsis aurantiaca]|uniref:Etoposide-induced protein 2.4-domain-containing protein n=1 Tax=Hygrophoropsis aurantiaca TaxID=72124 RepID=A0ACB8AGM4_9AGAM|nr:etoposide-induced protein 2.4-domain-containing protein [Hygrophoropsis aurantiaca]
MARSSMRPYNVSAPSSYPTHQQQSSRSSYPTFLSFQQTVILQATCALRDICWSLYSDPEIRANIFKSILLNSLSLTSIYTFDLLLQPLVRDHPSWLHRNVGWFYQVLWLLPVVGVSFYLNSTWCNLIAKRTFILQHGSRAAQQQPATYTGMLTMLATSAYRAVMVLTSIIVSFALGSIPYAGPAIGFVFLCWVDAYYCFEFIWVARGLSLSRRVRHLEERWAYYFAFGLPSAAICTWGSGLANAALFALMFPAFIIMAMHAKPIPQDPYNPIPNTASDSVDVVRYPSPYLPIRVPVFAVVIWLNDRIVQVLSVSGSGGTQRHHRTLSDSSEQVEEGARTEMKAFGTSPRVAVPRRPVGSAQNGGKVYTSGRRKAD